jgi:hypothetical protein
MLISQNDPIHHSLLGGNSTADGLTASKGARRLAADAVFSVLLRCYPVVLLAVIPSSHRQQTSVSAANRISMTDNLLPEQQKQRAPTGRTAPAICG